MPTPDWIFKMVALNLQFIACPSCASYARAEQEFFGGYIARGHLRFAKSVLVQNE